MRKPKQQHVDSPDCWCEPYQHHKSDATGSEVWVHRVGRGEAPAEALSEAVRLAETPDEKKMNTNSGQAQCAHIDVMWTPLKHDDGTQSPHWGCRNCGAAFVPASMYEVAVRCGYHLCTMVADNAVSGMKNDELREVAREKVRDHVTKAFEAKAMLLPTPESRDA